MEEDAEHHSDAASEAYETEPEAESASLLDLVLDAGAVVEEEAPARRDGVTIGVLRGFDEDGAPRVSFLEGDDEGVPARALALPKREDVGRQVALMFEDGDAARPLLMGTIQNPATAPDKVKLAGARVEVDGDRVELTAEREIVLRCGKASLTLTRAGKVLVRGAYVLTRSSGVNRIQGGSVQIN